MAARGKRSMMSSPTGPQRRSRRTTIRSERVLVKPMSRVASSRRDGEAGPGSKREARCEVVGRGMGFPEVLWEVVESDSLSIDIMD
jgi:hypothetical protein